ncbi:MAG: alanine dehydrogenase [Melioribacteraceae bacterium]|nr:MAG: alanine dehydrogenase [Melioribacteraceae bacterium]
MSGKIGIRKEDKNIWERRVPLIPAHVKKLKEEFGINAIVEPFRRRAFADDEYKAAGAELGDNLSDADFVFAVKEIPMKYLQQNKSYIFFSHTIKGQDYNMPLLQKLLDLNCTLIDYETMTNDQGRRVVFFGVYAGYAGMIDALNGLGIRLREQGIPNRFEEIKPAYEYEDLADAKEKIKAVGDKIKEEGLPLSIRPLVFGFAGYGNVSKGAQEIFDLLPFEEKTPDELLELSEEENKIIKVVFKEEHMVKEKNGKDFELMDYYNNPENYESNFEKYLDKIDVLVNAIYWDERYPVFVSKAYLQANKENLRLKIISDITCDIDGAIETTFKSTPSDNPAFVYDPFTDSYTDGYKGRGVVDIAVDNLPAEMPKDSSVGFSTALYPFVPGIVNADFSKDFEEAGFPPEVKRAVIVYKGELTPDYKYLEEYLKS